MLHRRIWDRVHYECSAIAARASSLVRLGGARQDSGTACIVFSKDRPAQLAALLESFFENVRPRIDIHVLYRAGIERIAVAYGEVFAAHKRRALHPRAERAFRDDLLDLMRSLSCERLFFLVDDIVFTEPVNLRIFSRIDLTAAVPSLRMGENLEHCYTKNLEQRLPVFEAVPGSEELVSWDWQQGRGDWSYPLSLDGHIFLREEMIEVCEAIKFKAPNGLEAGLQKFAPRFKQRRGICYRKSRLMNIPANRVQKVFRNRCGDVSARDLLERWESGWRIDHRPFAGFVNRGAHQEVPFSWRRRSG